MQDHWELIDLYKALFALAAGTILGLERELKDKSAGLKTISIICLGSCLFAIVSFKVGSPFNEPTRIASYIVSGVGFIGAGVIFKDGFNVSGLTTAGIIWLAAAVGTAIGFGEFFLALTFTVASLLVIILSPWMNRIFKPTRHSRSLVLVFDQHEAEKRFAVAREILSEGISLEEKRLEFTGTVVVVSYDAVVRRGKMAWLQQYLLNLGTIKSFSL